MGQGHGGDTLWYQHSQFRPVGLIHHCTSAQHMDSLSFKGRFNPGISQAFAHLLPRFQPRPPVNLVGLKFQECGNSRALLSQESLTHIPRVRGSTAAL